MQWCRNCGGFICGYDELEPAGQSECVCEKPVTDADFMDDGLEIDENELFPNLICETCNMEYPNCVCGSDNYIDKKPLISDETIREVERVSLLQDEELKYLLQKYRNTEMYLKEIKDKIDYRLKDCKNKFEDLI